MQEQTTKTKIAIFASRKFFDSEIFEPQKEKIKNALNNFSVDKVVITIGNIKNRLLIDFVKELGYTVNVIAQRNGSIENSNKKIIRENEYIIFNIYQNSSNMLSLYEYATEYNKNIIALKTN